MNLLMKTKHSLTTLCLKVFLPALLLVPCADASAITMGAMAFNAADISILKDSSSAGDSVLFSPRNILAFGNYLYCSRDYLRAIGEYENYLKHRKNDTVSFRIALSYSRLERYNEAEEKLEFLSRSKLSAEAILELAKIKYRTGDYSGLLELTRAAGDSVTPYYRNSLISLSYFSLLKDSAGLLPAEEEFISRFPVSDRQEIRSFYLRKKDPPYRNPLAAALFSAVIPGAGKIYSGQTGDGITSFIVCGLLGYLSYSNFNAEHNFRGWVFAGLTAYFYAGNIYGSAASAQIFNSSVSFSLGRDMEVFINKKNYYIPVYNDICR